MFPSTPQLSCDSILQHVRSSQLNFAIQETPFSFYFTIRKSFNKNFKSQPSHLTSTDPSENVSEKLKELEIIKSENKDLKNKCASLENANRSLTNNLEDEIEDAASIKAELDATIAKMNNSFKSEQNLQSLVNENKLLQAKHKALLKKKQRKISVTTL